MIEIDKLEDEIENLVEHLELMKKVLTSYSVVNNILKKNNIDLAKKFEIEIENLQYILVLAQLEILLTLKSIYYSKNDFEKIHIIKRGLHTIYETKISLDKLNPTLKSIKNEFPRLDIEFRGTIELIKQMKKQINSERRIGEIRNNVSAHINANFLEYYNYLGKINLEEDLQLLVRFKLVLNEIERFLFKVRNEKSLTNEGVSNDS